MTEIKVPDIGDFEEVPVIEILVEVGQEVAEEDPLVTLESDKATMDVPAPQAGKVAEILVGVGDKVSEGTPIMRLEGGSDAPAEETPDQDAAEAAEPKAEAEAAPKGDRVDVVVLGAGPGGYAAAFRAADLGLKTVLVERHERLGGVCLNVGCIPSKTLLHLAKVMAEAEEAREQGIAFGKPDVDVDGVRTFKDGVVKQLTGGLDGLAKRRKVEVIHGEARFTGPNALQVGDRTVDFEHAVIACGSSAATLPFLPEDDRIMDSTGALELEEIPKRLLVIGGGIIGLEMATVYDALGSEVTVVELQDQLIPGCDPDLVKPLAKRIEGRYKAIHLKTSVTEVKANKRGIKVTFDGGPEPQTYDRILVAVGRKPNGGGIGADAAGVEVDDRGFIRVDEQLRTNVPHIHAIGDVVGEPMLAHKATHEGHVAAEVIAGHDVTFDARAIPSVAYTDPEVAWMGLTETRAKAEDVAYEKAGFPWAASGRALTVGRPDGVTKLLVDPASRRILGAGVTGVNAGELIAELVHALEMGAVAEDVGLTVHPHPTLSETIGFAAEVAEGTITDIYAPKKREK
ncbi:MAG: dihydrolipoamide dehydrogenase [Solirubrobacteraceae bacterium]|nr:dihydrolipoamide dehydrogenase [Solirubrobacteraceae bacterium]